MIPRYCKNIGVLLVSFFLSSHTMAVKDSIGILSIKHERFIVYKVDIGNSLYSLSKRFNVSSEAIKKANGDTLNELKFEQLVLIPLGAIPGKPCELTHVVRKGETLYSIAKNYKVNVEDLRKWNTLKSDKLSLRDTIRMFVYPCPDQGVMEEKKDDNSLIEEEKKEDVSVKKDTAAATEVKAVMELQEEGAGSWIEDPLHGTNKNIALHKDLPVGTVIKVVNIMNGRSTHVKVVGKLPEKNEKLNQIIVISRHAAGELKIRDRYFRIKLYYAKPAVSSR